uniref:Uncharacterized protein n=1 Tax=Prymnesium polylepis TaxID=72548 RepID=A0A7S4HV86_9EUKA
MALSLAQSALAFAPALAPAAAATRAAAVQMVTPPATLTTLAKELNPVIGYWDPLGLGTADFWSKGNDATVGFLRHAEIKHGRVAMAAFVGYIAQYNGLHWGFPMSLSGNDPQYAAGLTPPEQWDALPMSAKIQILGFVGFLEFWGELGASIGDNSHYMKGGKPGAYPEFPEANVIPFTPAGVLSLYDPFGFSKNKSDEAKAKGLLTEINNGRLAMIGIMGFLAEQKVPGSVPFGPKLSAYAGEVMAPLM